MATHHAKPVGALKGWIRRTPALEELAYLLQNNLVPFLNFSGLSIRGKPVPEAVAMIRKIAGCYRDAAKAAGRSLGGARVLEIGPGDQLGVALCLIGAGARQVVALDRFHCLGRQHADGGIYRALVEGLPAEERERIRAACPWYGEPARYASGPDAAVCYIAGEPIETCSRILGSGTLDCAVSNATLEHVSDVPAAIREISRCLAPASWMYHEVDLRSHERFEAISPLHFLTFPQWRWRLMGNRLGIPNRARSPVYRREFEAAGYEVAERVLAEVPEALAREVLERVDPSLGVRGVSDLLPLVVRFTLVRPPRAAGSAQPL